MAKKNTINNKQQVEITDVRKEMKRLKKEAPWLFSGGRKTRTLKKAGGGGGEAEDKAVTSSAGNATPGSASGPG